MALEEDSDPARSLHGEGHHSPRPVSTCGQLLINLPQCPQLSLATRGNRPKAMQPHGGMVNGYKQASE
jgi:hypothetical protein